MQLHDPAYLAMLAFISHKNSGYAKGTPLDKAVLGDSSDFYYDKDFYYIKPESLELLFNNYIDTQEITIPEFSSKKQLNTMLENAGYIEVKTEGSIKRRSRRLTHNRFYEDRFLFIYRKKIEEMEVNAYAR